MVQLKKAPVCRADGYSVFAPPHGLEIDGRFLYGHQWQTT
jgi:hypothetical protein